MFCNCVNVQLCPNAKGVNVKMTCTFLYKMFKNCEIFPFKGKKIKECFLVLESLSYSSDVANAFNKSRPFSA